MLLGNSDLPTHSTLLFNTMKFENFILWIIILNMPGHDHSIARRMIPGDLNSPEALWLWNCPIVREGLDIWSYINE